MSTINPGESLDYYANVTGVRGKLGIQLSNGFSFNTEMVGSARVFSNDLAQNDPVAMRSSRFERQLTGFLSPMEKRYLGTIDVLNLHLSTEKVDFKLGRFFFDSPFLNKMDGRIKPTAVEGINLNLSPIPGFKLGGSYFRRFTTWGIETWKKTGDIIGHFGNGSDLSGAPNLYRGNIDSDGVIVGSAQFSHQKKWTFEAWNYTILDVNNTLNIKTEWTNEAWFFGLSSLFQRPLGDGINEIYFRQDEQTDALSMRVGYKMENWEGTLNYTRVGKGGRFIFPREFGTEDGFYTFQPRMRIEGLGDVHSYMASIKLMGSEQFSLQAAYAINLLPSSTNFALNKIGFDDYHQLTIDAKYSSKDQKWNARLLLVNTNTGGRIEFPSASFNKYFIRHLNAVINYRLLR